MSLNSLKRSMKALWISIWYQPGAKHKPYVQRAESSLRANGLKVLTMDDLDGIYLPVPLSIATRTRRRPSGS